MVFFFEVALLAALVSVTLKTDLHPGALACLYLIGWMTPWIIPLAIEGGFQLTMLAIPIAAFFASWALFLLTKKYVGKPWQWPLSIAGVVAIAALF